MSWKTRAACRGRGDLDWDSWSMTTATVCSDCKVRAECLLEALGEPETAGTWGFTSEAQRRAIRVKKTTVAEVWDANLRDVRLHERAEEPGAVPDALQAVAKVFQFPAQPTLALDGAQ